MMLMDKLYQRSVAENEKNLKFWENYLNGLQSLNFDVYAGKLKVPILVPIGNKILFRGELKHTNEVTVALGADYFVKCSLTQAEVLRQHRIKDAQSKVDLYKKEKQYLENQISFTKENLFENGGQEILEDYSEEEDKAWREKHRENVKKYKQSQAKENIQSKDDDAELWERLEELELQEELENELLNNYNEIIDERKQNTFLEKEEALLRNTFKEEIINHNSKDEKLRENNSQEHVVDRINKQDESETKSNDSKDLASAIFSNNTSQHELLQIVIDKQNELENKLQKIQHSKREPSKTEQDLIKRLDEMEMLDELEDEMEKLEDIIATENVENLSEDEEKSDSKKLKKSISFADEDNGETIEITFLHTDTEPNTEPFDPIKGILKPSDLYEAYSQHFDGKTTSILKKSKYGLEEQKNKQSKTKHNKIMFKDNTNVLECSESEVTPVDRTIVVKDIAENVGVNQHHIEGGARPTSLFKKRRMQNK